jgi:hypothetical protein
MDWDGVSFLLHADILENWNKFSLTLQSRILIGWEIVSFLSQADTLTGSESKYEISHVSCIYLLHSLFFCFVARASQYISIVTVHHSISV